MNILSWNVRGAGGTGFRRAFRDVKNSHNPDFVILMETRMSRPISNSIISNLGYESFFKVDAMVF